MILYFESLGQNQKSLRMNTVVNSFFLLLGVVSVLLVLKWRQKSDKSNSQELNISRPLRLVFLILFLLFWILAAYEAKVADGLQWKDFFIVLFSGLVFITLAFTILTYEMNVDKNRKEAEAKIFASSFDFASKWHSSPLVDYQKDVYNCEKAKKDELMKIDYSKFENYLESQDAGSLKVSIVCILNYFELVAIGVQRNLLNKDFINEYFEFIFIDYHNRWLPHIEKKREAANDLDLWKEFTTLASSLNATAIAKNQIKV